jgi:hypothetical protein
MTKVWEGLEKAHDVSRRAGKWSNVLEVKTFASEADLAKLRSLVKERQATEKIVRGKPMQLFKPVRIGAIGEASGEELGERGQPEKGGREPERGEPDRGKPDRGEPEKDDRRGKEPKKPGDRRRGDKEPERRRPAKPPRRKSNPKERRGTKKPRRRSNRGGNGMMGGGAIGMVGGQTASRMTMMM